MIHYGNVAGFIYRAEQKEQPKPEPEPERDNEALQRFKELCENKTKRCSRCGRELPPECFYHNKTRSDGLNCHCKACESESRRRRRALRKLEMQKGGAE